MLCECNQAQTQLASRQALSGLARNTVSVRCANDDDAQADSANPGRDDRDQMSGAPASASPPRTLAYRARYRREWSESNEPDKVFRQTRTLAVGGCGGVSANSII
jgi:hypothetical protein